jgi:ATP-dependent helicase/nuclease subunit B
MERIFLNNKKPLVHAVAEWLAAQMRTTPGGVKSLAHVLVVVPTRQAGRRLRLALAEQSGGCLPPLVRLPAQLIAPAHEPDLPVATPAENVGLLSRLMLDLDLHAYPNLFPEKGHPREKSFSWALGVARQLSDLWGILQENALTMGDVAARIETLLSGEDLDVEVARWQDLAKVEALFFETLRQRGRTPIPLARKLAVADPALPEGVEDIVLPALSDAQPALYPVLEKLSTRVALSVLVHADPSDDARFDVWGRPEPAQWTGDRAPALPLADDQITLASNSADQARLVAEAFAAVPPDEELPSLGMADEDLFSELQSAFLNCGLALHNPAAYPLAASSLGRLIQQLEQLCRQPRFTVLAAFLREADVMRWLESRLADTSYADILRSLDELQNAHLPQTLEAARRFCEQDRDDDAKDAPKRQALLTVLDEVRALLDPQGRPHLDHLTALLQTLFKVRTLQEKRPGDRELAAAAEATLSVFETLSSELLTDALDEHQRSQLFETLLTSATYQLEPENADALLTEGWLELPWSPAHELIIAGFNEGSVPDAVVGHAFLPDQLRQGLGLTSNERRTARDTYLLQALLASRPPNAVRIFLERVSSRNDVRKPSRLLFLCDEATLTARAKKLFRDAESAAVGHHRSLPDAWRLTLPVPQTPVDHLSATAFKNYLECPFTFYLRRILKMEACDDRVVELDAPAFGTLCHNALEAFGRSALKDSENADEIAAFLQAEVWRALHRQCGDTLPAILQLQASAACKRLTFFAARQARLRAEGWQIVATERKLEMTEHGVAIRGRADRIDHQASSDTWRIIDYKTWDRLGKSDGLDRFLSSGKADLAFAEQRGLASFTFAEKPRVWTDLQLPLYLLMARVDAAVPAEARVECGYFVLGETEAETVCKTWDFDGVRDDAVSAVRWVIDRVKAGIYWPPSPKAAWERDYGSLFLESPEQSVSPEWIAAAIGTDSALDDIRSLCKHNKDSGGRDSVEPQVRSAHAAAREDTRPPSPDASLAGEHPCEPTGLRNGGASCGS